MHVPPRPAARPLPCGGRAAPTARSVPRPSRARASAGRRGSTPRSRPWSARGRCPRSATRTDRPSRARGASCTVPSSRRRCAARLLEKARNVPSSAAMLVGAHVSTAGGLVQAHERAVERGCEAMQVFNQSPRMWRPTRWKPDDVAQFLELRRSSPVRSVMIHAVYLINPATKDREMRRKSADSLIHALRMGDEIRADSVVIHPGSTVGEPHEDALARAGEMFDPLYGGQQLLQRLEREI